MLHDDLELTPHDVQAIDGRDALASFFARLGYDTDKRLFQTADALGIAQSALRSALKHVERISANGGLQVYLFEVNSVTLAHRRAVTNLFNNRDGWFLFVLTTPDYERLDFVLVEHARKIVDDAPEDPTTTRARPVAISVERRKPTHEALRTLRRMTFTCVDDLGQLDKLSSAFGIAQWSERRFNNVALFSDHYLKHRLTEEPEWKDIDAAKAAFKAIRAIGDRNKDAAATTIIEVVLPVLKQFGHDPKSATATDTGPMFRLSEHVVCFAYHWQRSLDTKDEKDTERPDDIPAVRVVAEFGQGKAEWAILTNGKHWRLYHAKAHGRHANFYEVDFRETLGTQEADGEAFRYFWLMFRAAAFKPGPEKDGKPGPSFLDRTFEGSRTYAKELGERLKGRVFEEIFPHFAEGFIAHIRATEKDPDLPEERLHDVFRATLTLLYRLIFLLYAESLDLLPMAEVSYRVVSLRKLCADLAIRAGDNEAQADAAIEKGFSPSETGYYVRLTQLFRIVNDGESKVNVPKYNGGLFITDPEADDHSDEAKAARFLAKYRVPDRYLALGLDRLARDEDDRTHKLVPVDYKSLGVRQLGSIYEGLLEFKIQVASERMAIVKGKKGESIVPAKQAEKEELKVANRVRMHGAENGFLRKGSVYLTNDKHERKATGSYYTPDYIVKYIVEHTVGPVLQVKLDALRPEFRKAEAAHHAAKKKDAALKAQGLKGDDPEKVANDHKRLVDDLFTLRVLDPAMGSGHFLVEAVDFITDRMLAFLSGFAWNPVQTFIQRTRREIQTSLRAAGVDVREERLTDINLLKRHVLKRCIYGVDLNPMAVELAKVSLWLDCFTLGAPLSFLDHHLKCGNSLIGVTVDAVAKTVRESAPLWGNTLLEQLRQARDHLIRVGMFGDSTAEQVAESRNEFGKANSKLALVRRAFDIYTSQWFGNGYVGAKGKAKRKKESVVAAIEYLSHALPELMKGQTYRDPDAADWFNAVPEVAAEAAAELRFFHWELEFPEVFYAATSSSGQTIRRMDGAGFDAVVGNPPYVRQESLVADKPFFIEHFKGTYVSTADIYVLFMEREVELLRTDGLMGMIVANKWLRANYGQKLRAYLQARTKPISLLDFGHSPVFPDADTFPVVPIVQRRPEPLTGEPDADEAVFVVSMPRSDYSPELPISPYVAARRQPLSTALLRPEGWSLEDPRIQKVMEKIRGVGVPLKELFDCVPIRGIVSGFNDAFYISDATRQELVREDRRSSEVIKPLLRGRDIDRWRVRDTDEHIILTRRGVLLDDYPAVKKHLSKFRKELEGRAGDQAWYELQGSPGEEFVKLIEQPKIVYQEIQFHSWFALDTTGAAMNNKVFFIPRDDLYLLGVLASSTMWGYLTRTLPHMKDEALNPAGFLMEQIPIADAKQDIKDAIRETTFALIENAARIHKSGTTDSGKDAASQAQLLKQLELETRLSELVEDAYGFTTDERHLWRTNRVLRDPIEVLRQRVDA